MSMLTRLATAFRDLDRDLGVWLGIYPPTLHDYDLPDEPSVVDAPPLAHADASPLRVIPGRVDGLAAPGPTHPGAANHPSQYLLTDVEAAGAEWLATLRTLLARLGDTCADVVEHIDRLDPTPAGLAAAAEVTDLDAHRT